MKKDFTKIYTKPAIRQSRTGGKQDVRLSDKRISPVASEVGWGEH